jgi:hypothetical protein
MEPTTITTICMILFGIGMITWAIYLWFSDWQPGRGGMRVLRSRQRLKSRRPYGRCDRRSKITSGASGTSDRDDV